MPDAKKRADVQPGQQVQVVLDTDAASGKLTNGVVQEILTKEATDPLGVKVRLSDGKVGRVQSIDG